MGEEINPPSGDGIIGRIGPSRPEDIGETQPKSLEEETEELMATLGEEANSSAFGGELNLGQYVALIKTARAVTDYLEKQELKNSAFDSEVETLRIQLKLDESTAEELYEALANTTWWVWQTKPKYYAALEAQVFKNIPKYREMRKALHSEDK